jgi:DNA repair protein RadC
MGRRNTKTAAQTALGTADAATPFRAAEPHHTGHRERLRERFLEGGAGAMPDYELMELVLFAAIPRRDVKPLAKQIIAHFGSFAEAIAAPRTRLLEVAGDAVVTQLKIVEAAALRLSRTAMLNRPALSSWSALIDYCTAAMARSAYEEFRVLFLDRKNVLIADEVQARGTIDHAPVYPREIVKRALEIGASAVILVHNHPSGDPTPSRADIEMTRDVITAAKALKIAVHDHLVIGRSGHASFRALGLLA